MATLENPKHEIYAVELAAEASAEDAYLAAGLIHHFAPQESDQANRLDRYDCLQSIDARIKYLESLEASDGEETGVALRNARAIAELRWTRGLVENGGFEPEEWRDGDGELEVRI